MSSLTLFPKKISPSKTSEKRRMNVMIYLDANIFILSIVNNKENGESRRKLLSGVASGKIDAATSD